MQARARGRTAGRSLVRSVRARGIKIKTWFERQATQGRLEIEHASTTWRCNLAIADFADSIFSASWGFAKTVSKNTATTGHDGVFAVRPDDACEYVSRFHPLCLRNSVSVSSARGLALPFSNVGQAKGLEAEHVLVAPTGGVGRFLAGRDGLGELPCCSLYVAVTRARSTVAFVCDEPERLSLTRWRPYSLAARLERSPLAWAVTARRQRERTVQMHA